ncbi:MAG: beta-galactosidase [Candidatus Eisenbacteria bacterium]|nr:beta-galactosidase [Candidatus Eisenbacteria bacterium]
MPARKAISLAGLLVLLAAARAGAVPFPAGAYSLSAADRPASSRVYTNPSVAGVAVRTLWQTLETAEGQFDWSFLDGEIQTASAAGKKVSLAVGASSRGTPQWVYDAGAQPYRFIDQNPYHPTYGDTLTMPLPWDPVYLTKWTRFVRALGQRYANVTTLSYVKGSSGVVTNGWGLPQTDALGNSWAAYGYTPETLLAAMQVVVDSLLAAFPQTPAWVEVGNIKFEPQLSGHVQSYVAEQIAAYGFQRYPDRFGVWREDISGCTPDPPTSGFWKILWDHRGQDGAQMLWNVQDGPTRMNPCGITPNDKATVLMAAVQRGLDYGMPYLEIYQEDVLDTAVASVIEFAAEHLGGGAVGVSRDGRPAAGGLVLRCRPNPSGGRTGEAALEFWLPPSQAGRVRISVMDVAGRVVATPIEGELGPGWHSAALDARAPQGGRLASGVYLCQLQAGAVVRQVRVVILE